MTRILYSEKWIAAGDGSWLSGLSSTGNGSDRILACRILGSDCDINAAKNAGPYTLSSVSSPNVMELGSRIRTASVIRLMKLYSIHIPKCISIGQVEEATLSSTRLSRHTGYFFICARLLIEESLSGRVEWNGVCTCSTLTIPVKTPEAMRKKKRRERGKDVLLLLTCCHYSLALVDGIAIRPILPATATPAPCYICGHKECLCRSVVTISIDESGRGGHSG